MDQEELKTPQGSPARKPGRQSGFTLVEVMVTLAIIGLMILAVVLNVRPAQDKGLDVRVNVDIRTLSQAIELFRLDTNYYPEKLEDLINVPSGTGNEGTRRDGYIRNLPNDPWGNPYLYAYPGENDVYDIWSLGADGQEGGEGVNADINSWDR